ncbi:MAG: MurR/RpiR family transcriptional regulator [Rhodococcus fascians]
MRDETSGTGPSVFDLTLLTAQELRVGQFAVREPLRFATSPTSEIAHWTSTSEATVIRTSRRLGFSGLKEMKAVCAAMVEESRDLPSLLRSRLTELSAQEKPRSAGETAQRVATDTADLILQLGRDLHGSDALPACIAAIERAARVIVYGMGTAYSVADYAALLLQRIGFQALALTGGGHMNADTLLRLRPDDVLIVMAPRVIFPDVQTLLDHAVRRVATTVVVSQEVPVGASDTLIHLRIPHPVASASESVTAWVVADVILAELGRRNTEQAVKTTTELQQFREALADGRRGRRKQ